MMRSDESVHTAAFDHPIPGSETDEWGDYEVDFHVPDTATRELAIEDIFLMEGEERFQIDDDHFEQLKDYLMREKTRYLLQSAGKASTDPGSSIGAAGEHEEMKR